MKTDREVIIRVVRKGRQHKAHHGGAWKVAFADFMTAMMALFLVLWLITQSSEVRSAIAGYFQDPLGRSKEFGNSVIPGQGQPMMPSHPSIQIQPADGRRDKLLQLSQQVQAKLDANDSLAGLRGHVAIEVTPEGLRISLLEDSTDVFFQSGSAHPLPRAETLIAAIGTVLATADYPVIVEGHTDARQYSNDINYGNWELSADRANAARRLLRQGGIQDAKILAVRGLADRDPRIPANPLAPQNRRITIMVKVPPDDSTATPGNVAMHDPAAP